jgi:flagellar protein FlaJ
MFYFYPSTEKNYLGRKIDEEMPFVTIQMSAIAGSNIDPSKIFEILSRSKDYPNTRKEMIFLMNKVNIYGYNLATALRDSARYCSSKKLKDVLNGLSTTITSGGELRDYLTERAKTLLFEYKLDREKQNKTAETFIDIYISVVIAAPMILMLLLILINQTGIGTFGLSNEILAVLVIGGIAMINIVFLFILHLKQPKQ